MARLLNDFADWRQIAVTFAVVGLTRDGLRMLGSARAGPSVIAFLARVCTRRCTGSGALARPAMNTVETGVGLRLASRRCPGNIYFPTSDTSIMCSGNTA